MNNLYGIKSYQQKNTENTRKKVEDALLKLKKGKNKITYKLVAEKAEVSEQTLYKNEILKEMIKQSKILQKLNVNCETVEEKHVFKSEKDKKINNLLDELNRYKNLYLEQKDINAKLLGNLEKKASEVIFLKQRLSSFENINYIKK